jgi:hypothetical protein
MAQQTRYDVIIIGTGAGGATLAKRLAPSGMKILILERGDYVPREKENWSSLEVNLKGHYLAKEKWRTKDGEVLEPHTNYNVGGNTKFFFGCAKLILERFDMRAVCRLHGPFRTRISNPTMMMPRICSRFAVSAVSILQTRRPPAPIPFPLSHMKDGSRD